MLHLRSLSFSNFYSFLEPQHIDFTVGKRAPRTTSYFESKDGTRTTKVMGIVGHNASGKTNILKVLAFLKHFICDSFGESPDEPLKYFDFMGRMEAEGEFKVSFESNGDLFHYYLRTNASKNHVVEEKLSIVNPKTRKASYVVHRVRNSESGAYDVKTQGIGLSPTFAPFRRENASIISGACANNALCKSISDSWQSCWINLTPHGIKLEPSALLKLATATYHSHPDILAAANAIIAKFDLGLDYIQLREKPLSENSEYEPYAWHSAEEHVFSHDFRLESEGTRALYTHLSPMLQVLNMGSVLVIDELESQLHPYVTSEIVNLFTSEESNPHNAQLIFSTHGSPVLRDLDKYQILLTEKGEDGLSEVWRLDEVEGVRLDEDYFSKYLVGTYGAVPNL